MTALVWDQIGQRFYETGVDHGVLYKPNGGGVYDTGVAWSGLTTVTESPSGAESNPQYADNIKYLNLTSVEEFGGTIEALTYPDEFAECDGAASPQPGIAIGQQGRKTFGLSYRTLVGNDIDGNDHGFKIHLVWGATASPSEKAYGTVSDSPEPIAFSWDFSTIAVPVGTVDSVEYKPCSSMTIDSTKVDADAFAALMDLLYGTGGSDPSLPTPAYVIGLFSGTITDVFPTAPTYVNGTHTLTIPSVTGVTYYIGNEAQTSGAHAVAADTIVHAMPNVGYRFTQPSVSSWFIDYS